MENNTHPIELDDAIAYATPSKEKAQEIADRLIQHYTDNGNPLEGMVKVRWFQSILDKVAEGILSASLDEAHKYGKERITLYGAELAVKEAGTKWSYDNCNDPVYLDLNEKSGAMKDLIKERETFLKAIKSATTIVDDTTGEVVTINPPAKTSKTIVEVRFK